jgi:hypothetical protein
LGVDRSCAGHNDFVVVANFSCGARARRHLEHFALLYPYRELFVFLFSIRKAFSDVSKINIRADT